MGDANVVKLDRLGPKASCLSHPAFDRGAHPALAWPMRVATGYRDVRTRDFRESANGGAGGLGRDLAGNGQAVRSPRTPDERVLRNGFAPATPAR